MRMDSVRSFLFSDGGYSPHGFCIAWDARLLYTHVTADLLIALAYFVIPVLIVVFLQRRQDPSLTGPTVLFVAFITLCGLAHLLSIVTMYLPGYGLQGLVKLITGAVSVVTAFALWKLLPQTLEIPSVSQLQTVIAERDRELAQRRVAEADLAGRRELLEAKIKALATVNEELERFTYAASYELKAPANTLSLWFEEFHDEVKKEAPQLQASLLDAEAMVVTMRHLVEDILTYSRMARINEDRLAQVSLAQVFGTALARVREDLERLDAEVDVGALPVIEAEPAQMQAVADGLVGNAVKYYAPDRRLRLTIRCTVVRFLDAPAWRLSVADNGIGIDPAHHDRVQSLFGRLHRPEEYPGSGLGLALCRQVAISHGGELNIISDGQAGTEVVITIPQEVAFHVAQAA
jgi:signal transduction histidine kinase